jgi:hypothetical protein
LKRHRSISTGWEQPVDKEPAHRYVDSTARRGFGLDVLRDLRRRSGKPDSASESGVRPCGGRHLGCGGTRSSSRKSAGGGPSGRKSCASRKLRRRASRKQARRETRRARHVTRPRQARKRHIRMGGPARVASPATRVTGIATTGARVDAGWGLPACRARLRPSSQGGVRGSESGTGPLIRGASAGTSRKGCLHPVTVSCEGNLQGKPAPSRG